VFIDPLSASSSEFTEQVIGRDEPIVPSESDTSSRFGRLHLTKRVLETFVRVNIASIWPARVRNKFDQFFWHSVILSRLYRPSHIDCPTVVYWATGTNPWDMPYDFGSLLRGPWEQHTLLGDHLTIMREPNVESLAQHLRSRVEHPSMVGMAFEERMEAELALRLDTAQAKERLSNAISR
jgi:hypothetical protein